MRRAGALAAALGLLGALLALIGLRPSTLDSSASALASVVFLWGWFLTLSTPLITSIVAANLTTRMLRSEDFELVYVTPLPNRLLVSGQVVAVLYRLRFYLMVQAGLVPLLAVGSFSILLSIKMALVTTGVASARLTVYATPGTAGQDVLLPAVLVMAALGMLWNMNLLAASTGVRSALLREAPVWAGPSALLFIFGLNTCLCVLPVLLLDAIGPFGGYTPLQAALVLGGGGLLAILPGLLAILDVRWTAFRWAR